MSIATPIHDASLSIEELEQDIRRENERRYAFYRMLHATDRVLWRLEELNLHGVKTLPAGAYARMYAALRELPACALAELRDSPKVQEVLDSVFAAQDALLRWRDPERAVEKDDEEPEPVSDEALARRREMFRNAVLRRLGRAKASISRNYLINTYVPRPHRETADCWLDELEAEGLVRWEPAPPGRRYFGVTGEGG